MACNICKSEISDIKIINKENIVFEICKPCIQKQFKETLPLLIGLQAIPKFTGIDTSKIKEFTEFLKEKIGLL